MRGFAAFLGGVDLRGSSLDEAPGSSVRAVDIENVSFSTLAVASKRNGYRAAVSSRYDAPVMRIIGFRRGCGAPTIFGLGGDLPFFDGDDGGGNGGGEDEHEPILYIPLPAVCTGVALGGSLPSEWTDVSGSLSFPTNDAPLPTWAGGASSVQRDDHVRIQPSARYEYDGAVLPTNCRVIFLGDVTGVFGSIGEKYGDLNEPFFSLRDSGGDAYAIAGGLDWPIRKWDKAGLLWEAIGDETPSETPYLPVYDIENSGGNVLFRIDGVQVAEDSSSPILDGSGFILLGRGDVPASPAYARVGGIVIHALDDDHAVDLPLNLTEDETTGSIPDLYTNDPGLCDTWFRFGDNSLGAIVAHPVGNEQSVSLEVNRSPDPDGGACVVALYLRVGSRVDGYRAQFRYVSPNGGPPESLQCELAHYRPDHMTSPVNYTPVVISPALFPASEFVKFGASIEGQGNSSVVRFFIEDAEVASIAANASTVRHRDSRMAGFGVVTTLSTAVNVSIRNFHAEPL